MPTDRDIEAFFAAVDASDTAKLGTLFAPTVTLRVNAATPFSGREAVLKAFTDFSASFRSIHHNLVAISRGDTPEGDVVSVEADITFGLLTGEEIRVPGTTVLRWRDSVVGDYRSYIDLGVIDETRSERNLASVKSFLDHLEAMDFDAWAELFADVAVQENPYAPTNFPGRFVGKDVLHAHYASMKITYASMRFCDRTFHPGSDPDEIVAEFRGDIRLANSERKYDNRYCCVFRFDAVGKIVLYREYFNPQILIDAFAGAPAQLDALEPATS